ncbi:MAG TPA: AAA family ATPase [Acidobacteriaceae bacterium]
MARSDLLLNLVKAGASGERELFDKNVTALIADERSKSHHVLADALTKVSSTIARPNGGQVQVSLRTSYSDLLLEQEANRTLDDLVLPADVRLVTSQLIEEQQRADLLRSYSLEPRSRMLLTGPPGNGKTSLAEAIAASLSIPFFVVRYEQVVNSYLGETAKRLQELFQYARMHQCVLFFDEFDAIGKEREDRQESGEIKRVLNSLLLEVDRLPSYVILIAATNHPTLLDKAVWRRFQIKTTLPLPNKKQIALWFELLGRRFPKLAIPTGKQALSKLNGVSFSELEDLAQNVLRRCVLETQASPQHIFAEQIKVWVKNQATKDACDGSSSDSDISDIRDRGQSQEGRRRVRGTSTKSGTARRPIRSANSAARTSVR